MGEKSEHPKLYINGVEYSGLMEVKLDDDVPLDGFRHSGEIKGNFKLPKSMRCKSRKRFIKLLMADGVSRNSANRVADALRDVSYNKAFMYWILAGGNV